MLICYRDTLTSSRGRSQRGHHSVSKKVSYADIVSPKLETSANVLHSPARKGRKTTPKKYYFFSDYLKDYNPTTNDNRSPVRNDFRPISPERAYEPIRLEASSQLRASQYVKKEYTLSAEKRNLRARTPEATILTTGDNSYRAYRTNLSPKEIPSSPDRNDEEKDKIRREGKKDEIRYRLSQLSEKLYSPLKSTGKISERKRSGLVDDISIRAGTKESTISPKDQSQFITQ